MSHIEEALKEIDITNTDWLESLEYSFRIIGLATLSLNDDRTNDEDSKAIIATRIALDLNHYRLLIEKDAHT